MRGNARWACVGVALQRLDTAQGEHRPTRCIDGYRPFCAKAQAISAGIISLPDTQTGIFSRQQLADKGAMSSGSDLLIVNPT